MSLFEELSRRNVFRVTIAYSVASWVLLQFVDVIAPILELPEWAPKLILVLLLIGLVPAVIFSWAFELTPEGIKKESEVDRTSSAAPHTGRKLNFVIIGSLVVAVALLLMERQFDDTPALPDEPVAEASESKKSIAVLPFVNMSSDPEQEFFSDGITEEILNSLASEKSLMVAGRTSSFAFKGQNEDLRRIGDALGVDHILEGSVRKSGAQVRITAQLIQVDNGFHLWSGTYDRELTDVFAIQDEIATEILRQLRSQLLDEELVIVVEAKRTNPVVYDLYLRAKQRIYTRNSVEIATAIEELDKAIQLDPEYAPALAQRGVATMLLSDQNYGDIPDDEANRRGKRFLDRALRIDENLAEGLAAMGLYYFNQPAGAELAIESLTRALEINPNLLDASNWLFAALQGVGDFKGSMEVLIDVTERDPLYRPGFANAIMQFNAYGMPEKAEGLLKRIEAFDASNPDVYSARAVNYLFSGRSGEALLQIEKSRELDELGGIEKLIFTAGLMNTMQHERVLDEGGSFLKPFALYKLGRIDEAIAAAERQATSGFPNPLFNLLNMASRSKELTDYLEERWPTLSDFAAENRGDEFGYQIMTDVALAYSRTGNQDRFDEAMNFVEQHMARLDEQGINNIFLSANRGVNNALLGDFDAAIAYLESAADRGWSSQGVLAEAMPALAVLADDPRYQSIEAKLLENMNRDREVVGLPLLNADYEVEQDLSL